MKAFRKLAIAAAISASASTAMADPLTQLFFSQAAGWSPVGLTNNTPNPITFSGVAPAGAPLVSSPTISWTGNNNPAPGDPSSITLTSYTSASSPDAIKVENGLIPGNSLTEWNQGDVWAIDQLLQTNNVLSGGTFGEPTWIVNTIANFKVFSDFVGGNEIIDDPNSQLEVTFLETVNSNGDNCSNYPSPLADGVAPDCDDIYTVALSDFAPLEYNDGEFIYSIGFTLINGVTTGAGVPPDTATLICGFPGIVDVRCDAAGVTPAPGFASVYTPEYAPGTTSLYVGAFWTVREADVPAPGVLALLGIGLASVGFGARRKKA